MKSVTVIIPTYNRWPMVCDAIDSALDQSYQYSDCLVVDDASTDNTVQLLRSKYGDRIKIVSNETNKGQAYCRNLGAEFCMSDCICFLDSDDILECAAVEDRISFFNEKKNNVIVSFGLTRTSEAKEHSLMHKKKAGEVLSLKEYVENYSWCHNNGFLIDRKIFLRDEKYNELLRNKEDIELILRLLSKYPFYYCGTEIGEVRSTSNKRARNDYLRIIHQRNLFSDIVLKNDLLCQMLEPNKLHQFIYNDTEEELRALYKLGHYVEYRLLYKAARENGYIHHHIRFFKRYVLSFLK